MRIFALSLILMAFSCGGDDGGDDPGSPSSPDASPPPTGTPDAGGSPTAPDAAPGGTPDAGEPGACVLPANLGAVTFGMTDAIEFVEGQDRFVGWMGELGGADGAVYLELYSGYGAFAGGPIAPGTYQLTGPELSYETCGVCVIAEGGDAQVYFARGGTVSLQSVQGRITGSFSNVALGEADGESLEPIAGGCQTTIGSGSFDDAIGQGGQ